MKTNNLPPIVSVEEWAAAREKLLIQEKAATRARDALAAERRRLPMVLIDKEYFFEGPDGRASLPDLFEGKPQLLMYHFMFAPGVHGWPDAGCDGCSMFVDQIGHQAHFYGSDFNRDFDITTPEGEGFGLSVFLRDGKKVYRTYFVGSRGVEALGSVWTFLDLTPFGRQETWEDSPAGRPQTAPYQWWRRHDEY
jgi:predicted dithiol-disulfide oxidoreductase (DUF899 family)